MMRNPIPIPTDEPLTLPPVDPERPGQFVNELVALAERHAGASGSAGVAPGLLLAATIAAAERHGHGIGIGAQMVAAGDLMRTRAFQRLAEEMRMQKGETAGA